MNYSEFIDSLTFEEMRHVLYNLADWYCVDGCQEANRQRGSARAGRGSLPGSVKRIKQGGDK